MPVLEAARDLGLRNVAIHTALWLDPAPRSAFSLDDLGAPTDRFPELNFHIVHAGQLSPALERASTQSSAGWVMADLEEIARLCTGYRTRAAWRCATRWTSASWIGQDIRIDAGHVEVTLVLTDPSCVHFTGMQRFIRDELLSVAGVDTVEVVMSTRSLWTPDRIVRRSAAA